MKAKWELSSSKMDKKAMQLQVTVLCFAFGISRPSIIKISFVFFSFSLAVFFSFSFHTVHTAHMHPHNPKTKIRLCFLLPKGNLATRFQKKPTQNKGERKKKRLIPQSVEREREFRKDPWVDEPHGLTPAEKGSWVGAFCLFLRYFVSPFLPSAIILFRKKK